MKRTTQATVILAIALALICVGCGGGGGSDIEYGAWLEGAIFDAQTKEPLQGVRVHYKKPNSSVVETYTNSNGTFRLRVTSNSEDVQVWFTRKDYADRYVRLTWTDLSASQTSGQPIKYGEISLSPGSSSGTDDTVPPVISGVQVTDKTTNTAVVTWTTDEIATSVVDYYTDPSRMLKRSSIQMTKSHSVMLTQLEPGTMYYYRVSSADSNNNTASSGYLTFKTESEQVVDPVVSIRASILDNGVTKDYTYNSDGAVYISSTTKFYIYGEQTIGTEPYTFMKIVVPFYINGPATYTFGERNYMQMGLYSHLIGDRINYKRYTSVSGSVTVTKYGGLSGNWKGFFNAVLRSDEYNSTISVTGDFDIPQKNQEPPEPFM